MPRTKPQQIKPESAARSRWNDMAGADEAKAELHEVVEFLRDPQRFKALGAKVPEGHPAPRPARHRQDAAGQGRRRTSPARSSSRSPRPRSSRCSPASAPPASGACSPRRASTRPAIIFIDELDAVGRRARHRTTTREQRPDAQPAARRDGRLQHDRRRSSSSPPPTCSRSSTRRCCARAASTARCFVSPPDVAGREAILEVHARGKPLAADVDFALLARQTRGLTGADLANICNEAAIAAARAHRATIAPRGLRHGARARRGRHAVAPRAQRARAPRRGLARGRARPVRRAAARRRPRAQGLDRPPRPGAGLHAQPARRGPLPQDPRGAHRLHDDAPRRPRRRADRLRRGDHGRLGRPAPGRGDLPGDGARVRHGHLADLAQGRRPRRRGVRPHAPSCATRSSSTSPTRRAAPRCGSAWSTARRSTRSPARSCATRSSTARRSTASWPARAAAARGAPRNGAARRRQHGPLGGRRTASANAARRSATTASGCATTCRAPVAAHDEAVAAAASRSRSSSASA